MDKKTSISKIGRPTRVYYKTLAQAQRKARLLNAVSVIDYQEKCRIDPLLHVNPQKYYPDWKDWYTFLGTKRPVKKTPAAKMVRNHYPTIGQAMKAVKALDIKTSGEYQDRAKEDPRLHSRPWRFYAGQWKGWGKYLSVKTTEQRRDPGNFYPTYAEASNAAAKTGATSFRTYVKIYKVDPRLSSNPNVDYAKDWKGWKHFLKVKDNRYKTILAASNAAVKLGILSPRDYVKRYKLDDRLPSTPYSYYKESWVNWPHFLEYEKRGIGIHQRKKVE